MLMSAWMIMVDVHKHVITMMDPIAAPVSMVMSGIMIITHVMVCNELWWHDMQGDKILRTVKTLLYIYNNRIHSG